ncbi:MAG: hypothetical protein LBF37_03765 [Rickettsiales bacterium]|jgi:hypothetical protein|nr:hypothetical protein [Rickettsiales bacterium]
MTQIKSIFLKTFNKNKVLLTAFCALSISVGAAFSATSNGCDEERNDFINQRLALCTTHAYNIGATTNPESPAELEAMNEVVALKTTIMTQQMKKQYDYLEVTIKRFKTQLEKAILVAKVEAAGASSESGGASSKSSSSDKNIILSGSENCRLKTSTSAALECLQNNLRIVRNAVAAGNIGDAKRQLDKDISAAILFGIAKDGKIDVEACQKITANRDILTNCVDSLNYKIIQTIENKNSSGKNSMADMMKMMSGAVN